jgi:RNA polymerase sigma factor (sigma-70 family)
VSANDDWRRYRRNAASKALLEPAHERSLIERAQAGDRSAVTELVDSHMRLVIQISARYARAELSAHDLTAEGVLGLLEAITRFDTRRETRFGGYAAWWVRAYVHRHAADNRRIIGMPSSRAARLIESKLRGTESRLTQTLGRAPSRLEVAEALDVAEHDVDLVMEALYARDLAIVRDPQEQHSVELADPDGDPEEALAAAELEAVRLRSLNRALAALDEREQTLVRQHLYTDDKQTLAEVGRGLGISRQRAAQILEGARQKLRSNLAWMTESMAVPPPERLVLGTSRRSA